MPKRSRVRGWVSVEHAAVLTQRSVRGFHALIRYKRIVEHEHYGFDADGNLVINVEAYQEWASQNTSRGRTKRVMYKDPTKGGRHTAGAMKAEASNGDFNPPVKELVPKLVPLEVWAEQLFGEYAPHRNTLLNWRRNGRILPVPIKCGSRYFVEPTAVYADNDGEMARRLGNGC